MHTHEVTESITMSHQNETLPLLGSGPEKDPTTKAEARSSRLFKQAALLLLGFMAGRFSTRSGEVAMVNASLEEPSLPEDPSDPDLSLPELPEELAGLADVPLYQFFEELPQLTDFGATPSNLGGLQLCQGDCDKSADCDGELECFERDGYADVPGCDGNGIWDHDYCILPGSIPLKDFGATPSKAGHLKVCEGDCDDSDDCEGDLVCFQRSGDKHIPGCKGPGVLDHDYCIDPVETTGCTGPIRHYEIVTLEDVSPEEATQRLEEECEACAENCNRDDLLTQSMDFQESCLLCVLRCIPDEPDEDAPAEVATDKDASDAVQLSGSVAVDEVPAALWGYSTSVEKAARVKKVAKTNVDPRIEKVLPPAIYEKGVRFAMTMIFLSLKNAMVEGLGVPPHLAGLPPNLQNNLEKALEKVALRNFKRLDEMKLGVGCRNSVACIIKVCKGFAEVIIRTLFEWMFVKLQKPSIPLFERYNAKINRMSEKVLEKIVRLVRKKVERFIKSSSKRFDPNISRISKVASGARVKKAPAKSRRVKAPPKVANGKKSW